MSLFSYSKNNKRIHGGGLSYGYMGTWVFLMKNHLFLVSLYSSPSSHNYIGISPALQIVLLVYMTENDCIIETSVSLPLAEI